MIDYKEMMIGSLIARKEFEIDEVTKEESKVVRVDSIYFDALNENIYLINGYPCNFYDPILLSEDWLIKFNFSHSYKFDEWFQYADNSGISLHRNYDTGEWYIGSDKILYVHQFQNILRLKGVDIMID